MDEANLTPAGRPVSVSYVAHEPYFASRFPKALRVLPSIVTIYNYVIIHYFDFGPFARVASS